MKRFGYIGVLFVTAVLISGCGFNFEKPERFGIKTSDEAEYNLAIADKSVDLGEYFSISSLLNNGSSNGESNQEEENNEETSYKIYEYNPGTNNDKIKWLLLKMKMQDIPLDFGNSLEQTDISTSLDQMEVLKTIEIPDINQETTKDVELNVNEKVNALVAITGETRERAEVDFLSSNSTDGFSSIEYKSGTMSITRNAFYTDQTITGDVILKKNNNELSRATFVNGTARLPLENVIIEHDIIFEFTESNGVPFVASVDSDSVVKQASGLTITSGVPITASQSMPIGNQSNLESYTIGEGTLLVDFKLPDAWLNNGVTYEYTMQLSGALEGTLTETQKTLSLDGRSFDNQNLSSSVTGKIYLTNATLLFIDEENKIINPTVTVKANVTSIAEALVKLDTNYETTITKTVDLPETVVNYVKAVKWAEYGFEITYTNTLPEQNPVRVSITSDFFKLTDTTPVVLDSDTNLTNPEEKRLPDFIHESTEALAYITEFGEGEGKFTAVDVNATIDFPGYDRDTHTLAIRNIAPGATYNLGITVTPVLNWDKMWLDTHDRRESGKISTGMNLSSIFSSMEETIGSDVTSKIAFTEIPLFLFAETPSQSGIFDKAHFNGKIKAYLGNDDATPVENVEGNGVYLLGNYDAENDTEIKGNLEFRQGLSLQFDDNGVVTTDVIRELGNPTDYPNLADLLNLRVDGSLCVEYDVGLSSDDDSESVEITKSALDAMKNVGPTTISLSAVGIIRLEFDVKEEINMDIFKLIRKDGEEENTDLLGRTSESDFDKFKDYIKVIKSVDIIYKPSQLPFKFYSPKGDEMSIIVDFDGNGDGAAPKNLKIAGDTLTVLPDELLTYPLTPSVNFVIPKGVLKIPRETVFDTKLYLKIATSGEVIWLDKIKQNTNNEGGND